MQIVPSFEIVRNQESLHTNWLLPLSCHQCAQEVDRSMPLETNICPTVNTWTSSSHEFRVKKVVIQHVLITSLLPVKSIWSWGTRRMSYTMNFTMNSSPQFASSWNCQAKKTRPTRKGDAEEMKTCLLPDSLSSASVDDTCTMKYATNACDMCLILWFRLRHPLGQERLFVHWKALVHGCHVCFFNLAGIPLILSKSNISPIFKNSYVWRFYTCWSDCSWLPNCIL